MKKITAILALIFALFGLSVNAQVKTKASGFHINGNIDVISKKIGVSVQIDNTEKYDNGGKAITVTYGKIETEGQPMQKFTLDSFKTDGGAIGVLIAPGVVTDGEITIAGANFVSANDTSITITRFLPSDGDPKTATRTTYVFRKNVAVREVVYADGKKEKEQVLP